MCETRCKPLSVHSFLRRKIQTRAAQRAFRERKEKHARSLTRQLDVLSEKHGHLRESFTQQGRVMLQLEARIKELDSQLSVLRAAGLQDRNRAIMATAMVAGTNGNGNSHSCPWENFNSFDAVMLPLSSSSWKRSLDGQGFAQQQHLHQERPLGTHINPYGAPMTIEDYFAMQMQDLPKSEDLLFTHSGWYLTYIYIRFYRNF